jgi:3-oxosteroid 1-dehydrogenase
MYWSSAPAAAVWRRRLPNPNLHPLGKPPYYAFRMVLGDLGTSGGLRTDEFARALRADDTVVRGLYAVGNASAAVMGRSYAGATLGPAMTFGYVAVKHLVSQRSHQPVVPGGSR